MKHQTVRLTIDFPIEQHTYLKMVAAKKGISMRQYVIESLSEQKEDVDIGDNKFKKAMTKIISENDDTLRRLASE
jgi:predicted KAP-like P-loop ATPase